MAFFCLVPACQFFLLMYGAQALALESTDTQPPAVLEEIVVTAQKRAERLRDVPISISVLSGDALDKSTFTGVLDELNRVPGVVISPPNSLGSTQIAIRGVAANTGSSPIGYYLDAVPVGFVRFSLIPDSNAFDLKSVEVLRGPQGTLYGASAADGVVRVLTNNADPKQFDFKARVLGSGTDDGGLNGGGDIAVNVPIIQDKLAIRGVFGYQKQSGWIDRPDEKDANDAQLRNYRLKVNYQPVEALTFDLSLWSSRDRYGALSTSLSDRTAPNSGTTAEPVRNDFDAYSATATYRLPHLSITSMTSYLGFKSYNEQALAPYGGAFYLPLNIHQSVTSNVLSEEVLLNSEDTGPWRWTAGVFYRDDGDSYAQAAVPGDIGVSDFHDTSKSYALFGELGRRFWDDKFELAAGLRQFHDDVGSRKTDPTPPASDVTQSFHATTPRLVFSWYRSADMTLYASFSEGFRSGFPQGYLDLEVAPYLSAVKPDKLFNYEVGMKADFLDRRLLLDTSVYYVNWHDVQQNITVPLPGGGQISAVVNGQSASGPGVDFGVTARPTDDLDFGGTVSWNGLSIDSAVISGGQVLFPSGSRLNDSSQYTGSLFADWTFPLGTLGTTGVLSISGNYISRQSTRAIGGLGTVYGNYGDNLLFANASFTINFKKHWSVKAFGDNLTNEYGALQGAPEGYAPSTAELTPRPRPRTVGVEVDYRYH